MDFFSISGWIFGLASLIFGIIQMVQKKKYKKQVINKSTQKQKVKNSSTGYQAGGDINTNK